MAVDVMKLQRDLKSLGYYTGDVDGKWGSASNTAWDKACAALRALNPEKVINVGSIAWGAKVSPQFLTRVKKMVADLGMTYPDAVSDFMSCMAFETGRTFSPTVKNGAGAPYYGLIQFGAAAAKDAGTSIPELLKMTAEEQLEYVYNFFKPYKGKLNTLSDLYMRILWPAAVGKPESYQLWTEADRPTTYLQNKGLDINGDKVITKAECAAKVAAMKVEGMKPGNVSA